MRLLKLQFWTRSFAAGYVVFSIFTFSDGKATLAQSSSQQTDPLSIVGDNSNNNNVLQSPIQNNVQTPVQNQNSPQNNNSVQNFPQNQSSVQNSPQNQSSAQNSVQSPVQNQNNVNVPNIYPLQNPIFTPVNTENDFGFNLSAAVNTLDASNVTVFLGVIFQPGRTEDHEIRMGRLKKETELLESNKLALESQLILLQQQIEEGKIRLEKLQQISQSSSR